MNEQKTKRAAASLFTKTELSCKSRRVF